VHEWYQKISGKSKYEEAAFFMMLRRNGFRAWNLSLGVFMGLGGWGRVSSCVFVPRVCAHGASFIG
jgi:hypothetical protein